MTILQDQPLFLDSEWGKLSALFGDSDSENGLKELMAIARVMVELICPVIITNGHGTCLFLNQQALKLFGPPVEGSIFHLAGSEEAVIGSVLEQVGDSQEPVNCDLSFACPDGGRLDFDASIVPISSGGRRLLIWLFRDASGRIDGNGMIPARQELRDLIHSVSHDLKSPLVSLRGYTQLLREEIYHSFSETHKHYFDRLVENIEIIDRMIQEFMEQSRFDTTGEKSGNGSFGHAVST